MKYFVISLSATMPALIIYAIVTGEANYPLWLDIVLGLLMLIIGELGLLVLYGFYESLRK